MAPKSSDALNAEQHAALKRGCVVCGVRVYASKDGFDVRTEADGTVWARHNACAPRWRLVPA